MAITVKIEEKQDKETTYPCLMRHKTGFVVLFTKPQTGIVIAESPNTTWKIGIYDEQWDWPVMLEEEWEPSPPITIANA